MKFDGNKKEILASWENANVYEYIRRSRIAEKKIKDAEKKDK